MNFVNDEDCVSLVTLRILYCSPSHFDTEYNLKHILPRSACAVFEVDKIPCPYIAVADLLCISTHSPHYIVFCDTSHKNEYYPFVIYIDLVPAKPHRYATTELALVVNELFPVSFADIAGLHFTTVTTDQLFRLEWFIVVFLHRL